MPTSFQRHYKLEAKEAYCIRLTVLESLGDGVCFDVKADSLCVFSTLDFRVAELGCGIRFVNSLCKMIENSQMHLQN